MSEPFVTTVRLVSPPDINFGPVGEWDVPATAAEFVALLRGTPQERDAATQSLVGRLFAAFEHEITHGTGDGSSTPVGILGTESHP